MKGWVSVKKFKDVLLASLLFVCILGFSQYNENASDEKGLDALEQEVTGIESIVKGIYDDHAKSVGEIKKVALEKEGVYSTSDLSLNASKKVELAESESHDEMRKQVTEIMEENEWERIEDQNDDD